MNKNYFVKDFITISREHEKETNMKSIIYDKQFKKIHHQFGRLLLPLHGKNYMKYLFYVCVRFQAVSRIINLIILLEETS